MNLGEESEIRRDLLNRRKALSKDDVKTSSQEAVSRFILGSGFQSARIPDLNVGMYSALPSELDLQSMESSLREWGWKLHFPRIVDHQTKVLEFAEVHVSGDALSWKSGPYGIQEPDPELKAISPAKLDLIFVPGVGFGEQGQRIGMGGGYYDRFLSLAPQALRVALAFDFQVLPSVVQKSTDQSVHWIFTEKREIRTPFVNDWQKRREGLRG